jgi:hypothetical protein
MSDFKTVLIKDSRLESNDFQTFAVQAGPANNTYQQFTAVTQSSSSLVFNIQIPSESVLVDREVLISAKITFSIKISDVPVGSSAFDYGVTDALAPFPLNSLFTTLTSTINNTTTSINLQDVLPSLIRLNNSRELYRYNGTTPTLPDQAWLNYSDGVGSNSNPLASWNNQSYDVDLAPRGAFPLDSISLKQYDSAGAEVSSSPVCATSTNYFIVVASVTVTEPLFLSPFIFGQPEYNCGAMTGINTMNFVMNIDATFKRFFSTANSYTYVISPGTSTNSNCFQGTTQMLMNFLTTQPSDLIPSRNVLPYYDFPRYTSQYPNTNIASGASSTITSQNIQLSQLPDYFIINVRKPMSQQTIKDSSSFLSINNISINLNNQSGLLSSATAYDLWKISVKNGSTQSWLEFSGEAYVNNVNTGIGSVVPTTGSLLILNPAYDLSIPDYLSNSSLGQFNFQFNVGVTNNYSATIQPEIVVITANSGIFVNQAGTSVIYTGLLTKQMVLDTKEKEEMDPIMSAEHKRMIGGKIHHLASSVVKKMTHKGKRHGGALSASGMSGVSSGAGMYPKQPIHHKMHKYI